MVAEAMERVRDRRVVAALERAARADPSPRVRDAATEALEDES